MRTLNTCWRPLTMRVTLDQVEARIAPDQALFFINLTADEARKIAELTDDSAKMISAVPYLALVLLYVRLECKTLTVF